MSSSPDSKFSVKSLLLSARLRRISLILVVLVAAFGLFGYFAAPSLVKSLLAKELSAALHRPVTVEQVEIRPYALAARLGGVSVKAEDGHEVLGFEALSVNLEAASLWHRGIVIRELSLQGPRVRVTRLQGDRYDISDLLDEWMKPSDSPTPRFSVNNIKLSDGKLEFDDRPAGKLQVVDQLEIRLPLISSLPYQTEIFVEPGVSGRLNGSAFELGGKTKPFSPTHESELSLELENLDLTQYLPYVPAKLPLKLVSGKLSSELRLMFHNQSEQATSLALAGRVHLHELLLQDEGKRPVLALKRFDAAIRNADLVNQRFKLGRIDLFEPEVWIEADKDGELNLARLARRFSAAPEKTQDRTQNAAPAKPAAQALGWEIEEIELGDGSLHWRDNSQPKPLLAHLKNLHVSVGSLDSGLDKPVTLEAGFQVDAGDKLGVEEIQLQEVAVDLAKRSVRLGGLQIEGIKGQILRDASGIQWLEGPRLKAAAATPARTSAAANAKAEKPWQVVLDKFSLAKAGLVFEDRSGARPLKQTLEDLRIDAENLATVPGSQGKLKVAAKLNKNGELALQGGVQLQPLKTDLQLELRGFEVLALQPYFSDFINLTLTRGLLSSKAQIQLQQADSGLAGSIKGDLTLGDFVGVDKANSADFLKWKSLYFGNVDLRLAPLAVNVGDIALTDFYSRLILNADGKLNLSQIFRKDEAPAPKQATATARPASKDEKAKEEKAKDEKTKDEKSKDAQLPIRIGKITLQGGNINFSDRFIKPNYNANLTKVGGRVTGLSTAADSVADLDLRGSYDNAAPLSIVAKLNPLAAKPYLDLQAEVKGVEMTAFSPYAGKYAGYAIEKGKLSLNLNYKLENNQLSADNRVFLDQLTFGQKVDSPDATKLPVNLALSLLKNSRGEIDINLPISGSLDDPQFSVGGIVVKIIVNLLVKAVTSPFALLGSLFGGGEEMAFIEFDVGRDLFDAAAIKRLEGLAKALNDRPGLKLEVTGHIDPESDREGLRRAQFEQQVKAEKLAEMVKRGEAAGSLDSLTLDAKEFPVYLAKAYKAAKFPKPRNFIGMVKDLPNEEMEKLMLANIQPTDDDLRLLAQRRAQGVQSWLVEQGKVDRARIFLLPPKLQAEEAKGKLSSRRVDFSLR